MQNFIKAMKALSDETRLRILNLVLQRECCVCEVTQALDISQTRASRALSMLHEAGFLKLRKEGLWSHYSIDDQIKGWMVSLLESVKTSFKDSSVAMQDLANLKKAKRLSQSCCKADKVSG
jgi:ArsR family transcriptional regulator